MQRRPTSAIPDLYRRKEYCVEINVVLAHELVQPNVVVIEPPLFPILGIVGSDTNVTYARLKLGFA